MGKLFLSAWRMVRAERRERKGGQVVTGCMHFHTSFCCYNIQIFLFVSGSLLLLLFSSQSSDMLCYFDFFCSHNYHVIVHSNNAKEKNNKDLHEQNCNALCPVPPVT